MDRGNERQPGLRWAAALAMALYGAGTATAQDASSPGSFQLPPKPAPSDNRAGPVDAENPVVRSTPNAAPTLPVATPPAAPSIAVPPPAPRAEPTRRPRAERSAPARPASEEPTPAPLSAPTVAPEATFAPAPMPTLGALPPPTDATTEDRNWLWAALAAAVALLAGFALWRWLARPRTREEAADAVPDDLPVAPPPPSPAASSAPTNIAQGLEIRLEARELTGSLVYATLSYRLVLTNRGGVPTGPVAVAGDMVSAHASIDSRALLSPEAGGLAPLHEAPPLAPGESAELSGALRLPLAAILPLAGGVAFVPLARFQIVASTDQSLTLAETCIFVVGPVGAMPDDPLRPFRFDQFPGVVRDLGQREIRFNA